MKRPLNNEKSQLIRGKLVKSLTTFRKSKPNLSEDKFGAKHFSKRIYEILSAWRGKKQTQFKPKTNPIHERPKMNTNVYYTLGYNNKTFFLAPKTNPKQTQFKADTNLWRILNVEKNSLNRIILRNTCIHYIERYILVLRINGRLKIKLIPALKALTLKRIRKSYCSPRSQRVFALSISCEKKRKTAQITLHFN